MKRAMKPLLLGGPPAAWHLSMEHSRVPKEILASANDASAQHVPGVWEVRLLNPQIPSPAAIMASAILMDDRAYLFQGHLDSEVASPLLRSTIDDSAFARVIGPGGTITLFRVGMNRWDLVCVIRRRISPISSTWKSADAIMNVIRRRMPDRPGMVFHFDAGFFELGMTELQRVLRPVFLVWAEFTVSEADRSSWADAMIIPATTLSEDDDEGFGSWRNHEFC